VNQEIKGLFEAILTGDADLATNEIQEALDKKIEPSGR
jgi:hypothetical protein